MQKTAALRTLAVNPKWYTGRISHIGSKDAVLEMAGVWIIEDAEMTTLNRASSEASKQFLTDRVDRIRPPYGKYAIAYKRSCVFAATTNLTEYLKDPTGARRYWPLLVTARLIVMAWSGIAINCGLKRCICIRRVILDTLRHLSLRLLRLPNRNCGALLMHGKRPSANGREVRLDIGSLENVIKGALRSLPRSRRNPSRNESRLS